MRNLKFLSFRFLAPRCGSRNDRLFSFQAEKVHFHSESRCFTIGMSLPTGLRLVEQAGNLELFSFRFLAPRCGSRNDRVFLFRAITILFHFERPLLPLELAGARNLELLSFRFLACPFGASLGMTDYFHSKQKKYISIPSPDALQSG